MIKKMIKPAAAVVSKVRALAAGRFGRKEAQALTIKLSRHAMYLSAPARAGGGLMVIPHPARAGQPFGFQLKQTPADGDTCDYALHAGGVAVATYTGMNAKQDAAAALALIQAALTQSRWKKWSLRAGAIIVVWLVLSAWVAGRPGAAVSTPAPVDFRPSNGNSPLQDMPGAAPISPDAAFQAVTQSAGGLSDSLYQQAVAAAKGQGAAIPPVPGNNALSGFGLGGGQPTQPASANAQAPGCDPALAFQVPDTGRSGAVADKSKANK
ncbi:hypothetical protein [Paraburkholderia sediminicola]|uniref:hypothetical protein n=1 Tax=Paraburkholderia sediminicola TaxID=458836 RepID=UPI0038BBA73D